MACPGSWPAATAALMAFAWPCVRSPCATAAASEGAIAAAICCPCVVAAVVGEATAGPSTGPPAPPAPPSTVEPTPELSVGAEAPVVPPPEVLSAGALPPLEGVLEPVPAPGDAGGTRGLPFA